MVKSNKEIFFKKIFSWFLIIALITFGGCAKGRAPSAAREDFKRPSEVIVQEPKKTVIPHLGKMTLPLKISSREYTVGHPDVLEISIEKHEHLNREVTVSEDGTILFDFVGKVYVYGLTAFQIEELLTNLLGKDYIINPRVRVSVKEYLSRKIFVFGEVGEPGQHILTGYTTVLDLIPMVGGTKEGLSTTLLISRPPKIEDQEMEVIGVNLGRLLREGDLSQNVEIETGDIIYAYAITEVPGAAELIYILGSVENPGVYPYEKGLTTLDAILLAGGFTEGAAPNGTRVVRRVAGERKTIQTRMDRVMKYGDRDEDVFLEPGDFIIVPESWF